jgi:hypothetical protein
MIRFTAAGVRLLHVTRSKLACQAPPTTHLTQEGTTWDGGGTSMKNRLGRKNDLTQFTYSFTEANSKN